MTEKIEASSSTVAMSSIEFTAVMNDLSKITVLIEAGAGCEAIKEEITRMKIGLAFKAYFQQPYQPSVSVRRAA